jgi:hypothetical protein
MSKTDLMQLVICLVEDQYDVLEFGPFQCVVPIP